jgi:hypothetical protein
VVARFEFNGDLLLGFVRVRLYERTDGITRTFERRKRVCSSSISVVITSGRDMEDDGFSRLRVVESTHEKHRPQSADEKLPHGKLNALKHSHRMTKQYCSYKESFERKRRNDLLRKRSAKLGSVTHIAGNAPRTVPEYFYFSGTSKAPACLLTQGINGEVKED